MSKSRQRSRRKANSWRAPQTGKCPQCGSSAQPHRVCPSCGYYKGRQVVTIKAGA
ncbi:MAG: 50S ribosomal protein L32 [Verrucomicrobiia bacterium]